jgi:hypothetical protein
LLAWCEFFVDTFTFLIKIVEVFISSNSLKIKLLQFIKF